MTNTVPFPTSSQSASQQYSFEAPSGFTYVLHKLPATRYLALSNSLVTYFGEPVIKSIFAMVKAAQTEDVATVEKKTNAEMMEMVVEALDKAGGLGRIPLEAFNHLARQVCPFISVLGKPPVNPDELNVKMVDAKIDLMFEQCPADILPVMGRAIAFNLADFFSAVTSRLSHKPPKE